MNNFGRILAVAQPCAAQQQQARGMATLKAISIRLKSVKNIQKITQSMKMVSAAKYARAERDLKQARPYGEGATAFYERAEVTSTEEAPAKLLIAVTSDRGLCGAVHSGLLVPSVTSLPSIAQTPRWCALATSLALFCRDCMVRI